MKWDLQELLYRYVELVSIQTQSYREVVLICEKQDMISKKIMKKVQTHYSKIGSVLEVQNPTVGKEVVQYLEHIKEKIQKKQITHRNVYVLFLCQDHRLFPLVKHITQWKQQFGMEEIRCDYCVVLEEQQFASYESVNLEQYEALRYIWLLHQESFEVYLQLVQLLVIEKQNKHGLYGLMKQCCEPIQRERIYGLHTIYYSTKVQELCRILKREIQAIVGINRKKEEDIFIKEQLERELLLSKETYEHWKEEFLTLDDLFFVKSGYEQLQKKVQNQKRNPLQTLFSSWRNKQEEVITIKDYLQLLYGTQKGSVDETILEQYDHTILECCKKQMKMSIEQRMYQIPLLYLLQEARPICVRYANTAKRLCEQQREIIKLCYEQTIPYPKQMTYEHIMQAITPYKEALEQYQWQRANYLWWKTLERMFMKQEEVYKEEVEHWNACLNVCQNFIFEEEEFDKNSIQKGYNWKTFSIEHVVQAFSFQKDCEEDDIQNAYWYMTKLRDKKQRDGMHAMALFAMVYNEQLEEKANNIKNLYEMEDRKKIGMNGFSSEVILLFELCPLPYYQK